MVPKSSPSASDTQLCAANTRNCQSVYIVRHGDRWDYENPKWLQNTTRSGDPPLSRLGHQQARETGIFLDSLLANDGVALEDVTFLSSPFLRCLQTSTEIIHALQKVTAYSKLPLQDVKILPEYSVFEWDGKGGEWHASLPPLEERVHYFPRVDVTHESLFVPVIPEPRVAFHDRCNRVMRSLSKRYPYRPSTALIIVTHAAACIGLCRSASGPIQQRCFADINPAAPCSVYRLDRMNDTEYWELDPHDLVGGLNGHTDHLSMLGSKTVPWNHFGDKDIRRGYTGPLDSRFAPEK